MPGLVPRVRLWLLPGLLAGCVIAFAAGSGSLSEAKRIGLPTRWAFLFALAAAGLVEAALVLRQRPFPRGLLRFAPFPAAFAWVAIVSAGWSFVPRASFERGVSVTVLFVAAAALAVVADGSPGVRRRLFVGLGAGAGVVALLGFLMLAAGVDASAQKGGEVTPWRFRGFGENPNTVAILAAVALPIVVWLGLTGRSSRSRAVWALSGTLLLATDIATESRGGLLGAFVGGAFVLGMLIEEWPKKLSAVAAFTAAVAVGIVLRQATQPPREAFVSTVQPGSVTTVASTQLPKPQPHSRPQAQPKPPPPPIAPQVLPPRADEIGHPALSIQNVTAAASGRIAAWEGALHLVARRPLVGYGFGTEDKVFVDRWYAYQSARPENSAIGLLLQLGIVGLGLMLTIVGVLAWYSIRVLRGDDHDRRSVAVVGLGVLFAALAVTLIQSYVYAVGNIAVLTVWVTLFLLAAEVVGRKPRDRTGVRG